MSHLSTLRHASELAGSNRSLLSAKAAARLHRIFRRTLPERWTIGGVTFETGDLAHEPAVARTLTAMYHGNYETPTKVVLQKHLGPGGVFVDIGANIGYFSAVAASLVGPSGTVHAFEPVPRYAGHLRALQVKNPDYKIAVHDIALGDESSILTIDVAGPRNIGWNSLIPDVVDRSWHPDGTTTARGHELQEQVEVRVRRFDEYAAEREILDRIDLIKLDVEGFELNVLRGTGTALSATRPPIILEISPLLLHRVGVTSGDLASWAHMHGYHAVELVKYQPVPLGTILETERQDNVLLLPTR